MSCFVCRPKIFKSVAKVCFQYGIRQINRGEYPLTIGDLDLFVKKLAELNCSNYAVRYREEEVSTDVESFEEIPLEKITAQEIKDCDCWCYQTCDYFDKDELYKMVEEATKWAKATAKYSKEEYEKANWG